LFGFWLFFCFFHFTTPYFNINYLYIGLSDGGGGYPEDQIYFQRPLDISDPHHDPMEDNTLTGFTPIDHDFGSSLHMTNSLINISDT
jgi:hypothetical protein